MIITPLKYQNEVRQISASNIVKRCLVLFCLTAFTLVLSVYSSASAQQYLHPDGTMNSSSDAVPEPELPGNTSPSSVYSTPGMAPENSLTTDPLNTNLKPGEEPALPSVSAQTEGEKGFFAAAHTTDSALLHEGQMISDVKIEGNHLYSYEKILPYLKTRPGRPFNKKVLEDDVRRLIFSRMFVNVETMFKEIQNGNNVTLEVKFRVSERRTIQYIRYVGNEKIRKTSLEKEAYLKVGSAVDPSEIEAAKDRLIHFYHSKGFTRVSINVVQGNEVTDPGVIFQINEGPKQKIHWASFEGNTIASDSRLRTQIQSKQGFLWIFSGELDYEKIDADIKTLEEYYKNLGFLDVRIGREVKFNSNDKWAHIIFYIHEGQRYKIRNIVIAGASCFEPQVLEELMEIEKGDYLSKPKLTMGIRKIQGQYGSIGHVFADIKPDVRYLETPGECDIVIGIKEGDVYKVGRVNVLIAGDYPQTQIDTVLNRMTVRPGDIMDTNKIKASERRLKASQLFSNDPQKGTAPAIVYSPPEIKDMEKDEDEERVATPPSGNSQSFRGQSPDKPYRHVAHYTPSDSTTNSKNTVDVDYYGVWNSKEKTVEWQNVELKSNDGNKSTIRNSSSKSDDNSQLTDSQSQFAYESFEEYDRNNGQQDSAQKAEPQHETPAFLGQSGTQKTYDFDPFGMPSAPATNAQLNQTRSQASSYPTSNNTVTSAPTLQESVYAQPAQAAPATQSYSPAGVNRSSVPVSNWTSINSTTQNQTGNQNLPTIPSSPIAQTQTAPVAGAIGQNVYQDNLPLEPGIPAPNSPTGQNGGAFPAVNSDIQPNMVGYTLPNFDDRYTLPVAATLEETKTGRMMFSVGISSESGLLGSIVLDEQNFDWTRWPRSWADWYNGIAFRGRGQHFRIEASPGTNVQRYSISFGEPYLLNTNLSWDISGVYYQRYYDEWYEDRLGGQTSLGYHFHKDLVGYVSLRAYNVKVYHPIVPTPQELQDALGTNGLYGISARLVYDKRDSPYMATEGWYLSGEVEQVLGTYQYPRASFSVKKFIPLYERPDGSGRHVLSLKASADWTDVDTPIYEHYFTGGYSTIRGFKYRKATVRDNGIVVGGHTQVLACAEYMFPITADDMVKGVMFCDSGTSDNNFGSWQDRYRVSLGVGFRITIPWMGSVPIALDFAIPVSKNDFDETEVFSFTMGGLF